jgi:hypothetical protein
LPKRLRSFSSLYSPGQNRKDEDKIFEVSGLADYLTISPKWVYDHVHELPHFKLGGFLRFKKKEIDSAIDRSSLKSTNENIVKTYLDNHI